MAIKHKSGHPSSLTKSEVPVVVDSVQPYNYVEVILQSLLDSHLVYDGKVSGRHYEWLRSGDTVPVDERDAPELLSKRIGQRACCSEGLLGNKVFEEMK